MVIPEPIYGFFFGVGITTAVIVVVKLILSVFRED